MIELKSKRTMDNNAYWRDRYGFPADWGRIEFPRFANWVSFVMEERDPQTDLRRAHHQVRAYLDDNGNPRWYSFLDHRGQVLQRSEASWFTEGSDSVFCWLIDYHEDGFNWCPGPYTPFVAVTRWLRLNVCPEAAELFTASQLPEGWRTNDSSPGATFRQIELNRFIDKVRSWALHCYRLGQRESDEAVDHHWAWVRHEVKDLPLSIELIAGDVKSLWGETIDAREMEHVYDSYWLIRNVFVHLWDYSLGRDPNHRSCGLVEAMRRLDVKFRPVSDSDIFLSPSDHLRVLAEGTAEC